MFLLQSETSLSSFGCCFDFSFSNTYHSPRCWDWPDPAGKLPEILQLSLAAPSIRVSFLWKAHPSFLPAQGGQDGTGVGTQSNVGVRAMLSYCACQRPRRATVTSVGEVFLSRFMGSPRSESLELPVKYICIFQRKSSKKTFHSYYKAILGVNILIDVVRCTWELSCSLRQLEQMELWDSSRLGFSPVRGTCLVGAAGALTFSMLTLEK